MLDDILTRARISLLVYQRGRFSFFLKIRNSAYSTPGIFSGILSTPAVYHMDYIDTNKAVPSIHAHNSAETTCLLTPALPNAISPRLSPLFQLLTLACLTLVLYGPNLKDLVADWWNDPDYTHGFLVPIVVACILRTERKRYAAITPKPSNFGLAIMLFAVALLVGGTLAADYFTSRFSLIFLLAGMTVYLSGWGMLRAMIFPLGYLALMIPLPGIIYNQITFPLQLMASQIAEGMIRLTGIPVFREGNLLNVPHFAVEVAQACSGIRSFLSLLALALGYAYFADRRIWPRFALVGVMVPIAILTNAVRIMITTLLGYRFGEQWAEGFTHLFSGWLIYLVALALMFPAHAFIRKFHFGPRLDTAAHV